MVHYEPSATLSEYAEALEEQFGVTVCQDSMVLDGDKRQALIGPD